MSKIRKAFENKKAFIGFLTAGDPSLEKTEEFIVEMERAGAALIEIGIPFSDPIAEGPDVQEANVRALSAPGGCTTDMVFDMVARVSKKVQVPLVFLTYLNPIFKYGYEKFCAKCKETGISGIIIPDLPFEEKGELLPIADTNGVDIISLVAPTDEERIQMIAKEGRGYIYLVYSKEPKEMTDENVAKLTGIIESIRKVTDTPVVVSVDSRMPEKGKRISKMADGIIMDNAIVKMIAQYGEDAGENIYRYIKDKVVNME
jgi:tryptophan synthase alpha chain